ncbi:hypothetical protein N657DRAFT_621448 [Parathielavia appendiculata]|uniref:Uncharacterized protein n=1 Tax=Parathielavia appendiculata TaxID=2587402 RepID=A0AAN6TYL5_9PEZI|nr:hypothetical protein N657DRAFT_621448 [Parathielavia appendiculata]
MPTKGHHRSRSSIDRVIDLLADLEENQIALLLEDLNHTTSSNVPVSEAITLFERHASTRRRCRSPSPLRTLQVELERRHSKRLSSAPEPRFPSKTQASQPPTLRYQAASPPPPVELFDRHIHTDGPSPTHSSPPPSPPVQIDRLKSSSEPSANFRPRSYKRICRPSFLSPTATAELHLLLLAFFNEAPVSPSTTTATPSPTTPIFGFSHSPFSDLEPEPSMPGLDLLEPSPIRTPSFSAGRSLKTMPSIGSIFEAYRSQ